MSSILQNVHPEWKPILEGLLEKFPDIEKNLDLEKEKFGELAETYPPRESIFRAFNFFSPQDVKIIILGQDPYHQPGQANGLSFSVSEGVKIPPSLTNIFREIDICYRRGYQPRQSGDLTYWAQQGILMLNTTLTVRQGQAASHYNIWRGFAHTLLYYILNNQDNIILMLWGNHAIKTAQKLPESILEKHHFYQSAHPSPLSANRGRWFHQKMFTKVNTKLEELGKEPINW